MVKQFQENKTRIFRKNHIDGYWCQSDKDNQNKKEQENKNQLSKDNAERLLNAAMQEEKQTQQRLKKAMSQPKRKNLQKNW